MFNVAIIGAGVVGGYCTEHSATCILNLFEGCRHQELEVTCSQLDVIVRIQKEFCCRDYVFLMDISVGISSAGLWHELHETIGRNP